MKTPITRFIPENAVVYCESPIATIYVRNRPEYGKPVAIGYKGKSAKPSFYVNSENEAKLKEYCDKFIARQQSWADAKLRWKEEAKQQREELKNEIKVGDIYHYSWGYEQTQADFFQVVEVKGSFCLIREIGKTRSYDVSDMAGHATPIKDAFLADAPVLRRRIGAYIKIESYGSCSKWDGQPKYFSTYA